jgi:hypothetical protein
MKKIKRFFVATGLDLYMVLLVILLPFTILLELFTYKPIVWLLSQMIEAIDKLVILCEPEITVPDNPYLLTGDELKRTEDKRKSC